MNRFKVGMQLYSLRDEMSKDVEGVLKKVAEMGYDCVEFAGYYDYSAEELKALCKKYNLVPISVHQAHNVFLESPKESVEFLKNLGVKYSAIPYISPDVWANEYDKLVGEIKIVGKLLKDNGIQLLYHNHEFEFAIKRGDEFALDRLYEDVSSDFLCPELDMCWVNYAGQNPIKYVEKYGDIEEVLHLKDFECKTLASTPSYSLVNESGKVDKKEKKDDDFEFRPVGYGRQNIKAIVDAAKETKIKYLIVEQDMHPERTAFEDAKMSIDYLRSLGI